MTTSTTTSTTTSMTRRAKPCLPPRSASAAALAAALSLAIAACGGGGGGGAAPAPAPTPTAVPALTSPGAQTATVGGRAVSISIPNTGGAITRCSAPSAGAAAARLPAGLTVGVAGGTCAITGTVSSGAAAGSYSVAITATNSAGSAMVTVTIVVSASSATPPDLGDIAAPRALAVGVAANIVFPNSGGPATACAIAAPAGETAPAGITVTVTGGAAGAPDTCAITGQPTAAGAAPVELTVTATNPAGMSSATVTVTVSLPPALANVTDTQELTIGEVADIEFANSGGPATACALAGGSEALPQGLAVELRARPAGADTCAITGMPEAEMAQPRTVTVEATGAGGAASQATASITVAPPPPELEDIADAVELEQGVEASPIRFANGGGDVAATGGCALGAPLPAGLELRRHAPAGGAATCEIVGMPTAASAPATYTITATNGGGSDEARVTIGVAAAQTMAPDLADLSPARTFTSGIEITPLRFINSGGDAASCAVGANLPTGLGVRRHEPAGSPGGPATCEIHGAPDGPAAAAVTVTVTATNSVGPDSATVSIAIADPAVVTERPALAAVADGALTAGVVGLIDIPNSGGAVAGGGCSVSMGTLPTGLEVVAAEPGMGPATCRIRGTVAAPGAIMVQVTGMNSLGSSMADVTITVSPPRPALANIAGLRTVPPGAVIEPIVFTNTGGRAITGCTASPALPASLLAEPTTNMDSCQVSGTPAQASPETVYTITAANGGGMSMATVSIAVVVPPAMLRSIFAEQALVVGQDAGIDFVNGGNDVDAGGCMLSAASGSLVPDGLVAQHVPAVPGGARATCRIVGKPTAATDGPVDLVMTGTVAGAAPSTATATVRVNPAAPILADIGPAAVELALGAQAAGVVFPNAGGPVQAVSGSPACEITAPAPAARPAGITAVDAAPRGGGARTCALSGTPQAVTTAPVRITVTGRNATGMSSAAVTITVTVPTGPILQDIAAAQSLLAGAQIAPIAFANTGTGGLNAQTAATPGCAVAPALPDGLAVARSGSGDSCEIAGTPTAGVGVERAEYTVTAANADGSGSATVTITVHPNAFSQALGTHLVVEQSGAGGWTIDADGAEGGGPAVASGAAVDNPAEGEEGRSCLSTRVELPGRLSFSWRSGAGQGALALGLGGGAHSLPDAGAWDTIHAELEPDTHSRFANVSWCHPGDADGARLASLNYNRAPVGLEAAPATATQVNLRWEAFGGATHYNVWRGSNADGSGAVEISVPAMQTGASLSDTGLPAGTHHYWVEACDAARCTARGLPATATAGPADADGDGLIDIASLHQLHSVRHDLGGTSLRASALLPGNSDGCPEEGGCAGYELLGPVSFDADGDGATWSRGGGGALALDFGDHHHRHFNALEGGWEPVGDCGADGSCTATADNAPFAAAFDGGGHAVTGLATMRLGAAIGMFGLMGAGADISGLGLVGNLAASTSAQGGVSVGGLVGRQSAGSITASYATGDAAGGSGNSDRVGGLVGRQSAGSITASYATGDADGGAGASNDVGGLVGQQVSGSIITASYATGDADGSAGTSNDVGGLVGLQSGGSIITASYATGDADGGAGGLDRVGGLVGRQSSGSITASYALGRADGGAGASDGAGALVGSRVAGTAPSSWGFGEVSGAEAAGIAGDDGLPEGVRHPWQLDPDNAPAAWDAAGTPSRGAWDYGTAAQTPALNYADYDGGSGAFHCASEATGDAPAPDGAALIPGCDSAPRLIPGQRAAPEAVLGVEARTASATGVSLSWRQTANADGYQVFRRAAGASGAPERAGTVTRLLSLADTGLTANTLYSYWVVGCDSQGRCAQPSGEPHAQATARAADADGDGLIEIRTLADLNAVRDSLDGSFYALGPGDDYTAGCPLVSDVPTCTGFELTADLDFDANGNGWTWRRGAGGVIELDAGDHDSGHFDTSAGGWVPIGDCGADGDCATAADNAPFTATFDGGGHTIAGLATLGGHTNIGMFGVVGAGADIRRLGLVGNLAAQTGSGVGAVGGLVGWQDAGSIAASWATGDADGGAGDFDNAGGLAGIQNGGSITASYATGGIVGGAGDSDNVGGLVGWQQGGSITASWATGGADGGAGNTDRAGGLVGQQNGGSIAASWATGDADGGAGGDDNAGGLVGAQTGGSITASYATGDADGGAGTGDRAGGLAGLQSDGSITASYATGGTVGGAGDSDRVGGLVGWQFGGSITASWATGGADGGAGTGDAAGALVGSQGDTATITASWGFGGADGETAGSAGSGDPPAAQAQLLTSGSPSAADTDVPDEWSEADSNTLGAWDFGTATQTPALKYADYDGAAVGTPGAYTSGHLFHCDSDTADDPAGAIVIPGCDATPALIPDQRAPQPVARAALSYTAPSMAGQSGTLTLDWEAGANADGYRVFRGESDDPAEAVELTAAAMDPIAATQLTDDGAEHGADYRYWIQSCLGGECGRLGRPIRASTLALAVVADADGDGLIEISTLRQLHNIRHDLSGASYRTEAGGIAATLGCPEAGCTGFELTADLDFDANGNGWTWRRTEDGTLELDAGDHDDVHFNTGASGWAPVGGSSSPFTATFDGGGHSITGLATLGDHGSVGMFGLVGSGADIRRLGLVGNLAAYTGANDIGIGGLVGRMDGGSVVDCFATGDAVGSNRVSGNTGGLVGQQTGGSITTSWASGSALASGSSGFDYVGGLVGWQKGGSITASYATGLADGSAGGNDSTGGLVGYQEGGSITASYATGPAVGGAGSSDNVGGLVGYQEGGSITASYATGNPSGGAGAQDSAGSLVGNRSGSAAASWGYGSASGENDGIPGSGDRPADASQASQLTIGVSGANTNVPSAWNAADSDTLGAWNLSVAALPPRLAYADYDGAVVGTAGAYTSGHLFHCASAITDESPAPSGAIVVPNCGEPLPGQYLPALPLLSATQLSGTSVQLRWTFITGASYRVWRGTSASFDEATELTDAAIAAAKLTNDSLAVGTTYHYWVTACWDAEGMDCFGPGAPATARGRDADIDGDGLIEIFSAGELAIMAHDLAGSSYKATASATAFSSGCPSVGGTPTCSGYELAADIDFDLDGDGSTWSGGPGTYALDAGDSASHFSTGGVGWTPVGPGSSAPFTGTFEGNGHTISNLATIAGGVAGLFGALSSAAEVRNLGLVDNLAARITNGPAGGIAAVNRGTITASYATGPVYSSGDAGENHLGGLVGRHWGALGAITSCFATGDVVSGAGRFGGMGGLAGDVRDGATIAASYATGDVTGSDRQGDYVGGLVGRMNTGTITASWASGDVDAVSGAADAAGKLVGLKVAGDVIDSWGYGLAENGDTAPEDSNNDNKPLNGSADRPSGADTPQKLTTGAAPAANTNVPASWNAAASASLGAWDFGSSTQLPALNYADYDGATVPASAGVSASGVGFHCAGEAAGADASIPVGFCASGAPAPILGQRPLAPVAGLAVSVAAAGEATISWRGGGALVRVWRAAGDGARALLAETRRGGHTDTGIAMGSSYSYWAQACHAGECTALAGPVTVAVEVVDADDDGLIEIGTLAELHNIRHNLGGAAYGATPGASVSVGCPEAGCTGYELTADLDFDADGDGSTWSRASDGALSLDSGDSHGAYFDTAAGGWAPVGGSSARPFAATFDGGGRTITGLATLGDLGAVGMFGVVGEGADIRRLGLVGNLAAQTGSGTGDVGGLAGRFDGGSIAASWVTGDADGGAGITDNVGGLVGRQNAGSIAASWATGDADGSAGDFDRAGGLVGWQDGGSIAASWATGDADGGSGSSDRVGGLVGYQQGGSITASYATGDADGGAGQFDNVGGLAGQQTVGSITASYATGDADGGAGSDDDAGGLVGFQGAGSITASYATGSADGGAGSDDDAGGLVGFQGAGSITASYATGSADGGAGGSDNAGGLVGSRSAGTTTITASWGFGDADGETAGSDGSDDRPEDADTPQRLTIGAGEAGTDVPASWNAAASGTLGAWDFGSALQAPALNYADYDGEAMGTAGAYTGGHLFHCASDTADAPEGAVIVPGCDATPPLIPGQLPDNEPLGVSLSLAPAAGGRPTSLTLSWTGPSGADGWRVLRAATADLADAVAVSGDAPLSSPAFTDTDIVDGALYRYWVAACYAGECREPSTAFGALALIADADGDGLIEVSTLRQLHNVRHSLAGDAYRTEALGPGSTFGCPADGCFGFELTAGLDFDANGNGWTWRRTADGSLELDAGDRDPVHFDTRAGGWVPIGDCGADGICVDNADTAATDESEDNRPFAATFDGGGHAIAGLATLGDFGAVGMFGAIGEGAVVRRLGLVGNLAAQTGSGAGFVGGLLGYMGAGTVVACHATGDAGGGSSLDNVGGLVGRQSAGSIAASWATGDADGGAGGTDLVGGLVGSQGGGSIAASWATGDATGGAGGSDDAGGLVGNQGGGSITASYATGDAGGGAGDNDNAGGLVGQQSGGASIAASWATGDADGGAGDFDRAGGLVGVEIDGTTTASWGFGEADGEVDGSAGSDDRPTGATRPEQLTFGTTPAANTDAPASWNLAASGTLGAWDFGTTAQAPALRYADYDGVAMGTAPAYTGGHLFHCDSDTADAPEGAVVIPGCGAADRLIPGQRTLAPVERAALSYTAPASAGQSGTLTLDWEPAPNADGYRVFRGDSDDAGAATELTGANPSGETELADATAVDGAAHHYWVRSCLGTTCGGFGRPISTLALIADADGDGLIEVATLRQLHSIRHSLDGSRYLPEAGSPGSAIGCPAGGCSGFELTADLDFDANGNGWTWRRGEDGEIELDAGDSDPVHFDTEAGGWAPIGDCGEDGICADNADTAATDESEDNRPFAATFDGGGHAIAGLATLGDPGAVGMFGAIGEGAVVRRLGLVGSLAAYTGATTRVGIGGLAGFMGAGVVTSSSVSGPALAAGGPSQSSVGGLVGWQEGGSITASHATGGADGGAGAQDSVGSLVGFQLGGSITASYATGDADGGAGNQDRVGGLVGSQNGGSIAASWATGDADGGAGDTDEAGGLVGAQENGSITASYATGDADGGAGTDDRVGGLVGLQFNGTTTASYALGQASGGAGAGDRVGSLFGRNLDNPSSSWGFGEADGEVAGFAGSDDRPAGVMRASQLTSANVPASWNEADSDTLGAWDFSLATVPPQLAYADYDGEAMGTAPNYTSGDGFHCDDDDDEAPAGAVIVPGCDAEPNILPGQHPLGAAPAAGVALASATSARVGWLAVENAASYRVYRGTTAAFGDDTTTERTGDDSLATGTSHTDSGLAAATTYHYWVAACRDAAGMDCAEAAGPVSVRARNADEDADGLIEIYTAAELAIMANDLAGASYKATSEATGFSDGCPLVSNVATCSGYELAADIDFDRDGDGSTWGGEGGSYTLDEGDTAPHFDVASGGWAPVGASSTAAFTGTLDGNGRTISGLATIAASGEAGLFGHLSSEAEVRNLGLVRNLAARAATGADTGAVGGIAAHSAAGITASWATGPAHASGGGQASAGGLVGVQTAGAVQSCFATGAVGGSGGGGGETARLGGLVGALIDGTITASYATGDITGSASNIEYIGGLVGGMRDGTVTASWASGDVDGVSGFSDAVAKLVGFKEDGDVAASWGYGAVSNGDTTPEDSNANNKPLNGGPSRPAGAASADELTIDSDPAADSDVPDSWNDGDSNSHEAWDLGAAGELPALRYADYDDGGNGYHCASAASPPDGAALVASCGQPIAGQPVAAVAGLAAVMGSPTAATLSWRPSGRADYYRVLRAAAGQGADQAAELTSGVTQTDASLALTGLAAGTAHEYWALACVGVGAAGTGDDECSAPGEAFTLEGRAADIDGDGLIEIGSAAELAIIANDLAGASYKATSDGAGFSDGCPTAGCTGYELSAAIDFDIDGDGASWRRGADGALRLDAGDHQPAYFDVSMGGWAPIGDCGGDDTCVDDSTTTGVDESSDNVPFTATFDGGGHTIAGLATLGDHGSVGMFGLTGSGADIRRLGLVGNLAAYTGASHIDIGGLVGRMAGGSVVDCFATGDAVGSDGWSSNIGGLVGILASGSSITASWASGSALASGSSSFDYAGGLVGRLQAGSITASYATGDADGGAGGNDNAGGLVGYLVAGSITASYATGPADGGAGGDDNAGGLVGQQFGGSITASYATGPADGGAGTGDSAGSLAGSKGEGTTATASWGFGAADGETAGFAGSEDRPAGAISAAALTAAPHGTALTNAPASWGVATSGTLGAWDFGGQSQPPALRFADYDGAGAGFHCAGAASAPANAAIVPHCGALLPGQRALAAPLSATALASGPGALTLSWAAEPSATHYRVLRGATAVFADAEEVSPPGGVAGAAFTDDGLEGGTAYHYWVQSCNALGCTMGAAAASATTLGAGAPPILDPVAMPGAAPLYRYEIGRAYPDQRRIRFNNRGGAITGCTAGDDDLPRGMSIDTADCAISGAPVRRSERTTSHTVTATGAVGEHSVEIEIETHHLSPPDLSGATTALSLGAGQRLGLPISLPNAGGLPTACRVLSGIGFQPDIGTLNLRINRAADDRGCELSLDDPTKGLVATSRTLRFEATNAAGSSRVTLEVSAGEGADPSSLTVDGSVSSFTFAANSAITPIAFTSVGAGLCAVAGPNGEPLPAGLSADQATCRITGTPTQIIAATAYTATLARGLASASAEVTIAVTDAIPVLEATSSADLTQGSPDGLPVIVAATAGVPTGCTAEPTTVAHGALGDHNLYIYATGGGCAIGSIDGQGPAPAPDGRGYTLAYNVGASNTAGTSAAESALVLFVFPRLPVAVGVGEAHTCAISAAGRMYCWGEGSPKLGLGDSAEDSVPRPANVGGARGWRAVGAGDTHTCAINALGEIHCWGHGASGLLGAGDSENAEAPQRVGTGSDWASIEAGASHTCAINASAQLYCWGAGSSGRLGNGAIGNADTPQRVGSGSDWPQVSAGTSHTCAITASGELYCWGNHINGRLGIGAASANVKTPQLVGDRSDWAQVSAGLFHTCAITASGQLHCWGGDGSGQLGNGDGIAVVSPQPIGTRSDWAQVSAGDLHTCAITASGQLHCWGESEEGRLGIGDVSSDQTAPVQVTGADRVFETGWISVSAGDSHTCATRRAGRSTTLWCWGASESLGTGLGPDQDENTPVQVPLP